MKYWKKYWVIVAAMLSTPIASAQLPESGIDISQLDIFDATMQQVMSTNEIDSGVLAVSKDGVVVYQRGFGVDIPENTPMRLASVTKTIAATAIHQLIIDGALNFEDRVFDLGSGAGILPHLPWNGLGDARLANITVENLLDHLGGWDFGVPLGNPPLGNQMGPQQGDPMSLTVEIALRMGVPVPANRENIIRFMLSEPLQFTPGDDSNMRYSNFGYMVLGRIVEEVSGMGLIDFLRSRVITPTMWVPHQELFNGRSLLRDQDLREPFYQCPGCSCINVFDHTGPMVSCPYGGIHLEAGQGAGNLVASAVPLLRYMENFLFTGAFAGGFDGTSTGILYHGDGIYIVVLFARGREAFAIGTAQIISDIIDNSNPVIPTFAVDGFWVDFEASPSAIEVGGFNHPFRTMDQAVAVGAGTKMRLKPGSTSWTGTIAHPAILDAPFGTVTIGN